MKKVSIVVPCCNEAAAVPLLYAALQPIMTAQSEYQWEVLFINDGSKDETLAVIKALRLADARVNYVDLSRNFGKERAMLAGFDYVTGDCMVLMDADLQHPPQVIPEMLSWWEQGYDDVYGKRISRGREHWLRKRLSLAFYKILQKSARMEILQNVGDFRLLDRCCINTLKKLREQERYTKGMFSWIGFRKHEVLFETRDRAAGRSSWSVRQLFRLAVEGITSFTVVPLKISAVIGFIVSFFAFVYMIITLLKTLIYGEPVHGYPTIMVTILFLGGVQLISIGIIGEYLGRIFHETKNRPTYIAREYNGERVF
ncbi:MAG: glycosyltransferase family 2 protein [Bacteroidales bacterium]|jgi:glycosyltransferase involved in cell wall biosynthesis|nr:glycosyltransferase family 2 protein [Bacteroidales bacterium]